MNIGSGYETVPGATGAQMLEYGSPMGEGVADMMATSALDRLVDVVF